MNKHIDGPFFQLLLCSIGRRESIDAPLTLEQWEDIYKLAEKHAVLGLFFDSVLNLDAEKRPPRKAIVSFALAAESIAAINNWFNGHLTNLKKIFADAGMSVCVLKGQGIAALYPKPERRQCGDIDLWVDGSFEKILSFIEKGGWKHKRLYMHHIGVDFFNDKTDVEVHFHPSWFNNPFTNRKFKKYVAKVAPGEFANEKDGLGIAVTTSRFNCVFILLHIFRHLMDEGVGLRQLLDYYYVLMNSTKEDRDDAYGVIRELSLERFASALMWTMQELFHMEDEYLLCSPDASRGRLLLEEVLISGNFGKYDKRNDDKGRSFLHHFLRRLERLVKFLPMNASEVLWAPVFRIYQYFWRIALGYHY